MAGSWYLYKTWDNASNQHAVTGQLNLVMQKQLPYRMALRFRLCAGLTLLPVGGEKITVSASSFHVNTGVSFLWLMTKNLYLETGLDYAHYFTGDPSGCLRPYVGMGLQF